MSDYDKLERIERKLYEVSLLCNHLETALVSVSDPAMAESLYKKLDKASRKFTELAKQREALRKICVM